MSTGVALLFIFQLPLGLSCARRDSGLSVALLFLDLVVLVFLPSPPLLLQDQSRPFLFQRPDFFCNLPPFISQSLDYSFSLPPAFLPEVFIVPFSVVDDVGDPLINEELRFFRLEFQGKAEKDGLLWNLWEGTN